MSPQKLLNECRERNITLEVVDGQLRYRAPKGAMDPNLKKTLQDRKLELIAILDRDYYDRHIRRVIDALNEAGVRLRDFPPEIRKRALRLDEEMTGAANRGDKKAFQEKLEEWRQCFH